MGGFIFLFLSIFYFTHCVSFSLNTIRRFTPELKHGHEFAGCMEISDEGVFLFRFITGFTRSFGKSLRGTEVFVGDYVCQRGSYVGGGEPRSTGKEKFIPFHEDFFCRVAVSGGLLLA